MPTLSPRLARFAADFAAAHGWQHPPAPILTPGVHSANYAQHEPSQNPLIAHFPTSKELKTAFDIIRWTLAVAGIAANSPRFAYYVSRWDVPGKVARAHATDTFNTITANCPPIDPAWFRFVPAALAEHRAFTAPRRKLPTTLLLSPMRRRASN